MRRLLSCSVVLGCVFLAELRDVQERARESPDIFVSLRRRTAPPP
jgi:hypothetical protein